MIVSPAISPQTSWSLKRKSLSGPSGAPRRARDAVIRRPRRARSAASDSSASREGNSSAAHAPDARCSCRSSLRRQSRHLRASSARPRDAPRECASRWTSRSVSVLRRANSSATRLARARRERPAMPMSSDERERHATAASARRRTAAAGRTGRPGRTRRRAADSSRARDCRTTRPARADWASTQAASADPATREHARPPAHQPTRQHAASAGRSSNERLLHRQQRAQRRVREEEERHEREEEFPHPRSAGAGAARASRHVSPAMTPRVRNEREVARALDRGRQLTLMPRAHAAQAARQNLAVIGDEAAEGAIVLVVDEAHAALAEWAALRGRRMV